MSLTNTGAPWPVVHFGAIAEFKNGLNFRPEETGCEVKILGVGDFQTKTTLTDTDTLETIQIDKELDDSYYLRKGDLVFVRSNGNKALVGRCLLILSDDALITFSGFTIRARIKSRGVLPEYISLLMQFGLLRNTLKREGRGTNISNLNQGILSNLQIPLPSVPEQKAIVDLLSTWDEAIEKTEQLIQAKERRFQWLLREIMSDSAKGNLNKGWRKVAIGSFLTESRIPDTVNDPNKRLTVRLHLKGVEAREVRGTSSSDATAYFIRKSGQLVYGKQNIFRGAVGIIPPELDGYTSTQDIPAFDIDNTVAPDWLLFLFSYPGFYKKLEIYASGSGSKRLHPKDLFKIHVSVPPLEEQKRLADRLSIAQTEIDLLKELADRYKTQKRGLMQKLLTGQWRVKEEAAV